MQDKKVRISVEDQKLKDLGRHAKEMAADMIRSSRQYSTSSKEVLRDLEDQIKAIEKINKLSFETERVKLNTRFTSGNINPAQLRSGLTGVSSSDKDNQLTVSLLRGIIDEIKQTSKNEIREDRIGVEKRIRTDKGIGKLGTTRDPSLELKRTIQQGLLGDLGEEEQEQKQKFRAFGKFGKGAGRAFNTGAQLGVSKNEFYAAASILAMVPFVGEGLSQLGGRLFSSAEGAGKSKERFAQLNRMSIYDTVGANGETIYGVNSGNLIGNGRNIGRRFGMSGVDVINRSNTYVSASKGNQFNIDYALGAETNLGLNQGEISGTLSALRHKRKGSDAFSAIANLNLSLKNSGQSQTVLPEILSTFNQIASQIGQSGEVDAGNLSRSIGGISAGTGMKGQHLSRLVSGIQGMAGGGKNRVAKSMMINAFRKKNPNASWWEIQTMMESPMEHLDEMSVFLGDVKRKSGGGDSYKQALKSSFGDFDNRTINMITSGKMTLEDAIKNKSALAAPEDELVAGAKGKVSEMTLSSKRMDAFFQDMGDESVKFMDSMFGKITEGVDKMISGETDAESNKRKKQEYQQLEDAVAAGIEKGINRATHGDL